VPIVIKYDKPTENSIAIDSNFPIGIRNMDRMSHNFGTISGQVTLDASYPTGGYAVTPAKFGFKTLAGVLFEEPNGYSLMYNRTTDKVQVYSAAGTEVVAATNLSALQPVYFEAKGLIG
jgi:hypothetical protein